MVVSNDKHVYDQKVLGWSFLWFSIKFSIHVICTQIIWNNSPKITIAQGIFQIFCSSFQIFARNTISIMEHWMKEFHHSQTYKHLFMQIHQKYKIKQSSMNPNSPINVQTLFYETINNPFSCKKIHNGQISSDLWQTIG